MQDFTSATNTIILSDIHLADAEPPHPGNPLWKRFKRPKLFVDRTFRSFLEYIQKEVEGEIELVLNGDIFDFDSVMVLPEHPRFSISWLERSRGLSSEEDKSQFKLEVILSDHHIWTSSMREFIRAGNRVVFIIGNHDMELHWPSVQDALLKKLELTDLEKERVRFCEWYYISNRDTLIEHGNQYDNYCLCSNPVHPLIKKAGKIFVRLPFGNLAGKYMLNGMGLFNPHAESSFIKSSVKEYAIFYYKYVMRTQPFLIATWFWSAVATFVYSMSEGLMPVLKDPLMVVAREKSISKKSNSSSAVLHGLKALHVHPAVYNPIRILKELWLDRAFLLVLILLGSFWFFSTVNVFAAVSIWWFIIPFLLLLPFFIFYASSVESELQKIEKQTLEKAPFSAKIANVKRVVHGHTHHELHTGLDGIELLNTGTWSPAYRDVECTKPYGRKCFAWLKPAPVEAGSTSSARIAELYEWKDPQIERIPRS